MTMTYSETNVLASRLAQYSVENAENILSAMASNISSEELENAVEKFGAQEFLRIARGNPNIYNQLSCLTERFYVSLDSSTLAKRQRLQGLFKASHVNTRGHLESVLPGCKDHYHKSYFRSISFEKFFSELENEITGDCLTKTHAEAVVEMVNVFSRNAQPVNPLMILLQKHLSECIAYAFDHLWCRSHAEFEEYINFFANSLQYPIRIDLSLTKVTDEQLAQLKCLPINELSLASCAYLSADALKPFSRSTCLLVLDISCNSWVNKTTLASLPPLSKLSLAGCDGLETDGLTELSHCLLEDLDLFGCSVTDVDFSKVQLPYLKKLRLWGCKNLTEKALVPLKQCSPYLEELDLRDCPGMKTETLSYLSNFSQTLFSLSLWNWKDLVDTDLTLLANLKNLRVLNLNDCGKISAAGLLNIPTKIQDLSLDGCILQGKLEDALKRFEQLQALSLGDRDTLMRKQIAAWIPAGCKVSFEA